MGKNTKAKAVRRYVKSRLSAFFHALFYYTLPTYHIAAKNQRILAKNQLMLYDLCREQLPMDNKERLVTHDPNNDSYISQVKLYEFAKTYLKEGDEVLDIACGIGHGTHILKQGKNINITGVDISQQAIEHANQNYREEGVKFICSPAENFVPEKQFDAIVSFETIEHLENDEKFIADIMQHLKTGGIFVGSTANEEAIHYSILAYPFHYRHYTRRQASRLFRKSGGLKIESIFTQCRSENFEITKTRLGFLTIHVARKL